MATVRTGASVSRDVVDRLLHLRVTDAPVLSVYVEVPADRGDRRRVETSLHSMARWLREEADGHDGDHRWRLSLREDIQWILDLGPQLAVRSAPAVGLFACHTIGLREEVALPRRVHDRATIDATPYLRPLLAVVGESHRYAVVVVDRARAWFYELAIGQVFDVGRRGGPKVRKRDFGGWHGLDEYRVRDKAEELARRHYRSTAEAAEDLVTSMGDGLLIVGGHEETVAAFVPFLRQDVRAKVAGTFVIDTGTLTPAKVGEAVSRVVDGYERDEERRLVDEAFERAAAGGLAVIGPARCLLAGNEHAVQLLLVDDDRQLAGVVCDNCGWLGLEGTSCPVCGSAVRTTPDVIDELAAAVIDAGGDVRHVRIESALTEQQVAALCGSLCPSDGPRRRRRPRRPGDADTAARARRSQTCPPCVPTAMPRGQWRELDRRRTTNDDRSR